MQLVPLALHRVIRLTGVLLSGRQKAANLAVLPPRKKAVRLHSAPALTGPQTRYLARKGSEAIPISLLSPRNAFLVLIHQFSEQHYAYYYTIFWGFVKSAICNSASTGMAQ